MWQTSNTGFIMVQLVCTVHVFNLVSFSWQPLTNSMKQQSLHFYSILSWPVIITIRFSAVLDYCSETQIKSLLTYCLQINKGNPEVDVWNLWTRAWWDTDTHQHIWELSGLCQGSISDALPEIFIAHVCCNLMLHSFGHKLSFFLVFLAVRDKINEYCHVR